MRRRATAVVVRDGRVLLVRDRGQTSFSLPGGGAKKGEPSLAAAVRELYEELGLSAVRAERRPDADYPGKVNRHEVCLVETPDAPRVDGRELEEFEWWDRVAALPRFPHVDRILAGLGLMAGGTKTQSIRAGIPDAKEKRPRK